MRYLILVLLLAGCAPKTTVVDPCKTAPTVCWGRAGVLPADVSVCAKVASCYDWEMRAR